MYKYKIKRSDWYAIPNILGYVRILLIPLFVLCYINAETTTDYYLAALLVVVSSLTDMLDGKIARKCNQITDLGKILDPIADKLTLLSILICFLIKLHPAFQLLLLLFLIKELSMGLLSIFLFKKHGKKLDGAKWFGKFATAATDIIVVLFLLCPSLAHHEIYGKYIIYSVILVLAALMLFAFIMYTYVLLGMLFKALGYGKKIK